VTPAEEGGGGRWADCFVIGRQQGPIYHSRYFQLKSYTQGQKENFVKRNMPKYLAFGTIATLLQLIPGASILFMYTNTVGAALWAVELERRGLTPAGEDASGNELSEGPKSTENVKKEL
jgi:hypothetical protein